MWLYQLLQPKKNKQFGRIEHIFCSFNNNAIILFTNKSIHGWGTKKGKEHLKTFESYFLQHLHETNLSEKN